MINLNDVLRSLCAQDVFAVSPIKQEDESMYDESNHETEGEEDDTWGIQLSQVRGVRDVSGMGGGLLGFV
jgi:hypothetical protein